LNLPEGSPTQERPRKERETKEDGRYIIFYTFKEDELGEDEPSDEEGAAS
jgi:hypothetical protein